MSLLRDVLAQPAMSRYMTYALRAFCMVMVVLRFTIPPSGHPLSLAGSYEALAHLLVGGLVGAWLATKDKSYLWLAVGLSFVEIVAFLSSR